MKTINNCDLKSCFLCKQCLPAWIPAVEVNRKVMHFQKGELLFEEGNAVTGMYFVYKGLVKVHKRWGKDKELILRFATRGDILGHRGLGADLLYPISATALETSSVCYIPLSFFHYSLQVNGGFILELLNFFAEELKLSEQKMRNLAHMPVKGRITEALLLLGKKFGISENGIIGIELSRQDFASYIGTTYETAFRLLQELADEELVEVNKKTIRILDIQQLTSYQNMNGTGE